ncbi:hypothetical protein MRB53_039337 [Persea americana]|nr:hypothetical protein MRB53_039337 [Persea americana]
MYLVTSSMITHVIYLRLAEFPQICSVVRHGYKGLASSLSRTRMIMLSSLVVLAAVSATPVVKHSQVYHPPLPFDYGNTKVRGVNLGGWLVLEPWIKPSLFQQFVSPPQPVKDEWTFCQVLGKEKALAQLKQHWESWYTEPDFHHLKTLGINHVRIPIGYWAFDVIEGEPYVQGQTEYLERALLWASQAKLVVWIDLHGVPGSQNGFDNSGRFGDVQWDTPDNKARTLRVITTIVQKYGNNPVVAGIELVNEPASWLMPLEDIYAFYDEAYAITKSDHRITVLHDGYAPLTSMLTRFTTDKYQHIAADTHLYQIFSPEENGRNHSMQLTVACSKRGPLSGTINRLWTIVGEWSAAENDCATWLNGFLTGSRYEGSFPATSPGQPIGSCANENSLSLMSPTKKKQVKEFIAAQLEAYETGAGWIFWAGKTETADLWNFMKLAEQGYFPQPLGTPTKSAALGACKAYPYGDVPPLPPVPTATA